MFPEALLVLMKYWKFPKFLSLGNDRHSLVLSQLHKSTYRITSDTYSNKYGPAELYVCGYARMPAEEGPKGIYHIHHISDYDHRWALGCKEEKRDSNILVLTLFDSFIGIFYVISLPQQLTKKHWCDYICCVAALNT